MSKCDMCLAPLLRDFITEVAKRVEFEAIQHDMKELRAFGLSADCERRMAEKLRHIAAILRDMPNGD